jgi:hypothetical protein
MALDQQPVYELQPSRIWRVTQFFLFVPDEVQRHGGGKLGRASKPIIQDATDDLATYIKAYAGTGWVTGSYPTSWRHYQVGMGHLNRKTARDTLQTFRATAAAWSSGDDRDEWLNAQKKLAGYE